MRMAKVFAALVFAGAVAPACGDHFDGGEADEDAPSDGGPDAANDAHVDATRHDSASDDGRPEPPKDASGPDASELDGSLDGSFLDASSDASVDAQVDAGNDASTDSGGPRDAGALVCPGSCPPGKKYCNDVCVSIDDPQYGCSATSCGLATDFGFWSCERQGASRMVAAKCSNGACAVDRCFAGFADCNGSWSDGCEADLASPDNCGACGNKCAAGEVCNGGTCAATCSFPKTNCNGRCRDLSSDPAACGECGTVCPAAHGTASCTNGTCGLVCDPGFATCGATNGCVVNLLEGPTGSACGACNTPCTAAAGETAICTAGGCVKSCLSGYSPCNGACVDTKMDPANCGACGVACGAGQVCLAGACEADSALRIVSGLGTPEDIAVDANNVYFTDTGTNEVWQVDKTTFAKTLLGSGQAKPLRISVDDAYVYWTSNLGGAVLRAPIGGGAAPTVVYSANKPTGIVVDGGDVYWSDSGTQKVLKAAKAGGGVPVAVGTGALFLLADELKSDAERVYGASQACADNSAIFSIEKATGAFTRIVGCGLMRVDYGIAVDGAHAYWFATRGGGNPSTKLAQRGAATFLATPISYVSWGLGALAADDCAQYWTDGSSSVWKHASGDAFAGGRSARRLTRAAVASRRLAVDDTYVYWTDAGFVGRVPK